MKQRVRSAIIALIICIPIIIIGKVPFYLGASLIGLIGLYEMVKASGKLRKYPNLVKTFAVILFCLFMLDDVGNKIFLSLMDKLLISIVLLIIPIVFYNKDNKYDIEDALYLFGSVIFLGLGFNKLILTRVDSIYLFFYLLLVTTMTDTFAYFTGKLIGKNKMCESVSPNKTWEGFVGGLVFGTLIATVFYVSAFYFEGSVFALIIVTLVLSIIGQLGDLVFSTIKRHFKIKDFGNIMPGHGGVLDRLDSLLFVMIAFSFLERFL